MKAFNRTAVLSVILLAAMLPLAAAQTHSKYAGTPGADAHPDADVLVLEETISFSLLPDGRIIEKHRSLQKILTYEGMDLAGDPHLAFRKDVQDLTFDRVRTFTPWETVVEAQANSFNEMTPFALEKAPEYAGRRQMVVTNVGLDVGAVIEMDWTLADRRAWRPHLDGVVVLRNEHPALVRTVTVTVPGEQALRHRLFNAAAEPRVERAGGGVTYTWELRDIPLVRMGDVSEVEAAYLPTLVFTTCPDWAAAARGPVKAAAAAVSGPSGGLDEKVEGLIDGIGDSFGRAAALQEYVANSINTVNWPLSDFAALPRAAAEVYDSGYGHALDKAVLLSAMLSQAGIEAPVALCRPVAAGGWDVEAVPCLTQMDRCLLRAKIGNEVLWMDPVSPLSKRSQRDFQGYKGLPLVDGIDKIHTMSPLAADDRLDVALKVDLSADLSFEGTGVIRLAGGYSPFYAVQGCEKKQKGMAGKVLSTILPGAQVTGLSVRRLDPARCVFRISFEGAAPDPAPAPLRTTVGMPPVSLIAGIHGIHRSERDLPLDLGSGGSESLSVSLTLADGLKVAYLPSDISLSNAAGTASQAWAAEEETLRLDAKFDFPNRIVAAKDYPNLKALHGAMTSEAARTIIFK